MAAPDESFIAQPAPRLDLDYIDVPRPPQPEMTRLTVQQQLLRPAAQVGRRVPIVQDVDRPLQLQRFMGPLPLVVPLRAVPPGRLLGAAPTAPRRFAQLTIAGPTAECSDAARGTLFHC
jgi:hypothetical protein